MNRIFRLTWSKTRHTWVVASENTKRAGKAGGTVDERATAFGLARERGVVEDPPLAFAWQLRLGSLLVLLASSPPTYAIDYYWDVDGGTTGTAAQRLREPGARAARRCPRMSTARRLPAQ